MSEKEIIKRINGEGGPKSKPLGRDVLAAIVEVDIPKLDREGLLLCGMCEMLTKYRTLAEQMGNAAEAHNWDYASAMFKMAVMLREEEDQLRLAFYKAAVRTGAATRHDLKNAAGVN